ncbi:DUF6215 domain-containing protein [Streptomyces cocklensis]|jgi:hypothetical protein|nr:DUF6215 domain-containing protein [Actinacidiphila cocklensis]MDD1062093.1 DUF6215 domain-containing protein [Actinacidiphila cocklensis]
MADSIDAPAKGAGEWGQAVTALVLVGALGAGLWAYERTASSADSTPVAATCSSATPAKASPYLTATQLCEVLNRPDLAELLGTPGEIAKSTGSSGAGLKAAGGEDIPNPSAQVQLDTYTVNLAASYDHLSVAEYAELFKGDGTHKQTVLGRTAVSYSDRTMSLSFRLDGGDSRSRPGVMARSLLVARDAEDSGGSFELSLWRADGVVPDDAMLARLAQTLLPTLPGWDAEV